MPLQVLFPRLCDGADKGAPFGSDPLVLRWPDPLARRLVEFLALRHRRHRLLGAPSRLFDLGLA